jgi:hypothetical protein
MLIVGIAFTPDGDEDLSSQAVNKNKPMINKRPIKMCKNDLFIFSSPKFPNKTYLLQYYITILIFTPFLIACQEDNQLQANYFSIFSLTNYDPAVKLTERDKVNKR